MKPDSDLKGHVVQTASIPLPSASLVPPSAIVPILYWESGADAQYKNFNESWLSYTGRTFTQEIGDGWTKGIHPEDDLYYRDIYFNAFNLKEEFRLEFRLQRSDKSFCWMLNIGMPQFAMDGSFEGYKGYCIDINTSKLATDALKESEKKFRMMADCSYDWEYWEGMQRELIYISPSCERITGYNAREFLCDNGLMKNIIHPADREKVGARDQNVQFPNHLIETSELDFRIIKKDGTICILHHSCTPVFDEQRNFLGRRISNHDITDQKKLEDTLKASERRYRRLFESAGDGVIMLDAITGKITDVNPALINMLGYTKAQLFEKEIWEIGAFKDIAANQEKFLELQQKQIVRYEDLPIETAAGQIVNVEFVSNVYIENSQKVIQCNIRNITNRKMVEASLAKSESRYRGLMNNLEAGVVFHAADTSVLMSNPKAAELLGISANQMDGSYAIDPQWHFFTEMEETLAVENYPVNQIIRTKQAIKNFVFGITRPATKDLVWLLVNGFPVLNSSGEIEEILISFIDLTEIKKAGEALKKITADLKTSNSDLENFAYVASHDLQEPLRMVHSFLNLLEKKLKDQLDDTTRQYIHFAVDGAARMKILINDLLQYSRIGSTKEGFTSVDTNLLMNDMLLLLSQPIADEGATIITNNLPVIKANKTLMNELLLNLVTNALKYRGEQDPEIELGCLAGADRYTFFVKDNGIGISPEFFDRIFIIFKRLHTKETYAGTGIGLALCKRIVETHKGKIWVESEPGNGSTFYFTIPK